MGKFLLEKPSFKLMLFWLLSYNLRLPDIGVASYISVEG